MRMQKTPMQVDIVEKVRWKVTPGTKICPTFPLWLLSQPRSICVRKGNWLKASLTGDPGMMRPKKRKACADFYPNPKKVVNHGASSIFVLGLLFGTWRQSSTWLNTVDDQVLTLGSLQKTPSLRGPRAGQSFIHTLVLIIAWRMSCLYTTFIYTIPSMVTHSHLLTHLFLFKCIFYFT